jgi:hypothetical protein
MGTDAAKGPNQPLSPKPDMKMLTPFLKDARSAISATPLPVINKVDAKHRGEVADGGSVSPAQVIELVFYPV